MKKTWQRTMAIVLTVMLLLSSVPLNGLVGLEWPSLGGLAGLGRLFDLGSLFTVKASAEEEGGFQYAVLNGTYCQITGYTGSDTEVTVPGELGEYIVQSIGDSAFADNDTIESVTLPDSIESIGESVFSGCSQLAYVGLNEGLNSIGRYAFSGCSSLSSLSLPDTITAIQDYAFYSCTGLTELPTGQNVGSIGYEAFAYCSGLTAVEVPGSVTEIDSDAFYCCSALTTVDMSEGLTSIGSYAFSDCTALTGLTLPDSVTSLGCYIFRNCPQLISVNLPAGLTQCGYNSSSDYYGPFAGSSIATVTIPETVTAIPDYTFSGCATLEEATLHEGITRVGHYAFKDCAALTGLTLPDSVTTLGYRIFQGCANQTSINLPAGLTNCDAYHGYNDYYGPFAGSRIVTATVPESLTAIPAYTFYYCSALENVTLHDEITEIGNYAFYECSNIKTVEIPAVCETVGEYAFYGCPKIKTVEIPAACETVGEYAFYGCGGMTALTIDPGVVSIDDYAFAYCTGLKTVTVPATVTAIGDSAFSYCSGLMTVNLSEGLTGIGSGAFSGCTALPELTLPDSVTTLGYSVFDGCAKLISINLPAGLTHCGYYYYYDRGPFTGSGIVTVTAPDGMTAIPAYTFLYCSTLESVVLPDSVAAIGYQAFYSCTGLKEIWIPEATQSIDSDAFCNCGQLTIHGAAGSYAQTYAEENNIPFSTEEILHQTAKVSGWVKSKSGVNIAGVSVSFYNVTTSQKLVNVCETGTNGKWSANALLVGCQYEIHYYHPRYDIPPQTCTVAEGGVSLATVEGVKQFDIKESAAEDFTYEALNGSFCKVTGYTGSAAEVLIPAELDGYTVREIADSAFRDNTVIEKVALPKTVETMGNCAFCECPNLQYVGLNTGLKNIAYQAFGYCGALSSVSVPFTVTDIDYYAFYNCAALTTLNLSEGLKTIGSYAFSGCAALTGLVLPDSVTSLGCYIFQNCPQQTSVNLPAGLTQCGCYSSSSYEGPFAGSSIATVTIPETMTAIPDYTFSGCATLEEATLHEGITRVGHYAFNGCAALTGLTLPDSVTTLGYRIFQGCANQTSINLPAGLTNCDAYHDYNDYYGPFAGSRIVTATVPEGLTAIPAYTFYYCSALENVTLHDEITEIGDYAFFECSNIKTVEIPAVCETVGEYAFYGCSNIRTVEIPAACETVCDYAFYGCGGMTALTIDPGVVSIGDYAFAYCTGLKTVTVPATVTTIGYSVFRDCTGLKTVNLSEGLTSIGSYAFSGCTALTELTLPDSVSTLGYRVFDGCAKLISINLPAGLTHCGYYYYYDRGPFTGSGIVTVTAPDGMTAIPDYTFCYCSTLESVVLSDSVAAIGYQAFYSCTGLKEIWIPEATQSIESDAFYNCGQLTIHGVAGSYAQAYAEENGIPFSTEEILHQTAKVSGWVKSKSGVNIAGVSVSFYNVTTGRKLVNVCETGTNGKWSANGLLVGCQYVIHYYHPRYDIPPQTCTVTEGGVSLATVEGLKQFNIKESAAEDFTYTALNGSYCQVTGYTGSDAEVLIPAELGGYTVQKIANSAFNNNTVIEKIAFPDTVETMGSYAFYGCANLQYVGLNAGLTNISQQAFYGCSSLASVSVPFTVTDIDYYAFYNCAALTTLNLSEGLKTIGSYAFSGCAALTGLVLPDSVTSLGCYIFQNCPQQTSVNLPAGLTQCGYYSSSSYEGPFAGSSIATVTIPETMTAIPDYTFSGCATLEEATLHEGITRVGHYAFNGCAALTGLTLPDSVTTLGYRVFQGCTNQTSINLPAGLTNCDAYIYHGYNTYYYYGPFAGSCIVTATVPESLTVIPAYTFYQCSTLENVTIHEGITAIGGHAFYGCPKIKTVEIPAVCETVGEYAFYSCDGMTALTIDPGVVSIGNYAFSGCTGLKTVTVPATVTTIGNSVFRDCTGLKTVNLSEGLTSIGSYAFSGCTALTELTLPGTVTATGYSAFSGCTSLATVNLSEGLQSIDGYAFDNCTSLPGLTLPDTVTSIGSYAFRNCSSLTGLVLPDSINSLGYNIFEGCENQTSINLPASLSYCDYYTYYSYGPFAGSGITKATVPEGMTAIPAYTFCYCDTLKEVVIPATLTSIGGHAFQGCTGLRELRFTKNIASVGEYAFYNCSMLRLVEFNDKVTSIGQYAFSGCTGLVSLVINEALEGIPDYAFYNCYNLKAVTIPREVPYVSATSFNSCGKLTIYCYSNSAAQQAAENAGYRYFLLDDHEHAYVTEVEAEPTCTESGSQVLTCSVCGYSYIEVLDPLGHDMGAFVTVTEVSCTVNGLERSDCSRCDYYETHVIEAPGHRYGEWTVSAEPTCTEDGSKYRTCSVCEGTDTVSIEKLGHQFGEWQVTKPATVLAEGEKQHTCARCHTVETAPIERLQIDITQNTDYGRADFTVVNAQTQEPIANAHLYISTENDGENTFNADENGCVSVVLPVGKQTVSAYAEGCQTRNLTVTVASGVNTIDPIGLSDLNTYDVQLTSHLMTEEEIEAAGIDTGAAENQQIYKYDLQLEFTTITTYYDGLGNFINGFDINWPTPTPIPDTDPTYHLHYHVNEDEFYHSWCKYEDVEVGDTVELTYRPTSIDVFYEFDGWYADQAYTQKITSVDIKSYAQTGSYVTTVYGHWIYKGPQVIIPPPPPPPPPTPIPVPDLDLIVVPVREYLYLIIHGEVHWQKEMFDVEMLVVNNSQTDTLENLTAELVLPEGLSLATMIDSPQDLQQYIGTVPEGESRSAHWYVRGDTAGDYNVQASLTGTVMPFEEEINDTFAVDGGIHVWAGNALHLDFEFPSIAFYDEDYPVKITLTNVSDITLYNVTSLITGVEQAHVVYYSNGAVKAEWTNMNISGQEYCPRFEPGDQLVIELSIKILYESEIIKYHMGKLTQFINGLEVLSKAVSGGLDAAALMVEAASLTGTVMEKVGEALGAVDRVNRSAVRQLLDALSSLYAKCNSGACEKLFGGVRLFASGVQEILKLLNGNDLVRLFNATDPDDIIRMAKKIQTFADNMRASNEEIRNFVTWDSLRSMVAAVPMCWMLNGVILRDDDPANTTRIPWSYHLTDSGIDYTNVLSWNRYFSHIFKLAFSEFLEESAGGVFPVVTGFDDPFYDEQAKREIIATQRAAEELKARDSSGARTFTAYVVKNGSSKARAKVPANGAADSGFLLACPDNETAVYENGVLTFTGEGTIQVTPTSSEGGTLYVEDSDGNVYEYEITVVEEHECTPGAFETVLPPTGDADGFAVARCTVCGDILDIKELSAKDCEHSFGEWTTEVPSTCVTMGLKTRVCAVCGYEETEYFEGDVIGHRWNEGTVIRQATLTQDGEIAFTCTVCEEEQTETIPKVETVALSETSFVFNGQVRHPDVTVRDASGDWLEEGVDYLVAYPSGCKNAGDYRVTVLLAGQYDGSCELPFTIAPQPLDEDRMTLSADRYVFSGAEQRPDVTVKNAAGNALTEGTSYTLTVPGASKLPGVYTVTVTGKGNYTGTVEKTYEIEKQPLDASRVTLPDSIVYNGSVQLPPVTVKNAAGNTVSEQLSYTVAYASQSKTPGTYTLTVTGKGNYTGEVEKTYKIEKQPLSADRMALSAESFCYNGSVQQPEVTVTALQGTVLKKDGSYTLTWSAGSRDPGTYTVTATGKGYYTGTAERTYTIEPQPLAAERITLSAESFVFNGEEQRPTVTVTAAEGDTLTEGDSYEVTFAAQSKKAGTYTVSVTGKGSYCGTVEKTYTITPQPLEADRVTLSAESFIFNAAVQQPAVAVKNAVGNTLTANTSYTVAYSSGCKLPGTYTVTVTGKGNYGGTVEKTFVIEKQPLSADNVTLAETSLPYNGGVQQPAVTVKNAQGGVISQSLSYTVACAESKYPGTYTLTVTGKGNYTGEVTKTYKIVKQTLTETNLALSAEELPYNGSVQKPELTVTAAQGTVLKPDGSYTAVWSADSKYPGAYTVTVTGKGYYTGTAEKTYTITKQPIDASRVTLAWETAEYTAAVQQPEVTVTASQGTVLKKDGSYTVTYAAESKLPGTYTLTVTGKGYYEGTVEKTYAIGKKLLTADNVTLSAESFLFNAAVQQPTVTVTNDAGTVLTQNSYTVSYAAGCKLPGTYTVTVTGKGNYGGTVEKTFVIEKQPLAADNVTLAEASLPYNGGVQQPEVTVKNAQGNTVTQNTSYTVACAESKYPGTYTLTVTGKGNYTGEVTKTYKIVKQTLTEANLALSAEELPYNGSVQRPELTVTAAQGTVLKPDGSYTAVWSANSKYPGAYTVTVTGKGYYTGTAEKTYTVTKQPIDASRVTLAWETAEYTAAVQQPDVTVTASQGTVLKKDGSYTVTYAAESKLPGTYTLTVTGKGYYEGTVEKTYTIGKKILAEANVTLSAESFAYNAAVQQPAVTVTNDAGTVLTQNSYRVTYSADSKLPGTYTVTVTGKGNYGGSVTKEYTIGRQALTEANVTLSAERFTYNAAVQQPAVTVTNGAGSVLTQGASYTVTYSANSKFPGVYTVTVTGRGNYGGTAEKTYTIEKQTLTDDGVTLSSESLSYGGVVLRPTVTVKNAAGSTLTQNASYTLTYSGGCKYPGTYTVTVTGKGNYEGTVEKTYKITKQTLTDAGVALSAETFSYNGQVQQPAVTVTASQGTVLTENGSYTVSFSGGCQEKGTYTVTVTGKGYYTGKVSKTFQIQ